MEDLLNIKFFPEKAKPGIRYISTAIKYFIFLVSYNLFHSPDSSSFNVNFGLFLLVVWIIYFPVMEGVTGSTLMKKLFKLKVVTKDYTKINIFQAFVRRIFDIVDILPLFGILGMIVASSTKNNQRIGDLIAGTIVIKD